MTKVRKLVALVMALALALSISVMGASAAEETTLAAGTYDISEYTTMSMYISAMGGVDFATGAVGSAAGEHEMLEGATLTVDASGNATVTLSLGYSAGTIYTVAFKAFVDPRVAPCYYDDNGDLVALTYTLSEDTLTGNSLEKDGSTYIYEEINYIDSMTVPVSVGSGEVTTYLYMFLNSNVMGCLFCDGSGSSGSNQTESLTPYAGKLILDWDAIVEAYGTSESEDTSDEAAETSTEDATVTYTYEAPAAPTTYPGSIPATIPMGLTEADLAEDAYFPVTAPTSGTLSCGDATLPFSNTLESGNLTEAGDTLNGTVELTQEATVAGDYSGTLTFTISLYTGD